MKNNFERFSERTRNRNKSVSNKVITKLKHSSEDENINDKNDYNDSYEDYLISPDNSLDNKL